MAKLLLDTEQEIYLDFKKKLQDRFKDDSQNLRLLSEGLVLNYRL